MAARAAIETAARQPRGAALSALPDPSAAPSGPRIGTHRLAAPLLLAPMAGITDRPFRELCRRFGAALTCAELVSANPDLRATRQSRERLTRGAEAGPLAMQIVGADPRAMAELARHAADQGASIIDINLGCPARNVCRHAAGSALLRDEPLIARIFAAVVAAVAVPVTVKTRTGWSPATRNLDRIGHLAREAGIALLSVHGRTRACGYDDRAEHDSLRALRGWLDLPLVANGDIDSPTRARAVLDHTGADAVMIGRAALGRPWIFEQMRRFLATGQAQPAPAIHVQRDILLFHLDALYSLYGNTRGPRIARKHILWYCRDKPGFAQAREHLFAADSTPRQRERVESFFAQLT